MKRFLATLAVMLTLALGASPVLAQQPFAAAATVNGQAITNFQVQQRAQFFALLRAPNSDFEGAKDVMIDETLQVQAARAAGIQITPDQLDVGMVEFASRANLEPDQFIAVLEQNGLAPETFRDFVRNNIYWRTLIQQRFGPRARPTDTEVERALARGGSGGVRVLISEIALPLTPETQPEVQALAQRLSDTISGQAAFEQAARTYSKSRTAPSGGRLNYLSLAELSPQIASQVLTLGPGEVSDPVNLGSFIGLFLLRDLEETGTTLPETLSIDYAEYLIAGGRTAEALTAADRLRDRVDVCDDLYGVALNAPEGTLTRAVLPTSEIPADLRQELAKLDEGEASTLLTRDGYLRFVMMCGRVIEPSEEAFESLGQQLLNQRLGNYADSYLDELRADAIIEQ
ncbi:periplasmic chaperone for outer membrane proteins SurA [Jannaschia faecimaris]|uniref:Parvulin-like PPIase n=1 Tax=Jannaschia faecimaris TaxID=1244108 RepID=A0A1H3QJG7_9RHOB|nr:peptidylprolyl isomerase [Jannaschia faecimaris]SDZ12849.1 periplasmic chaperone for outer membrane proteins SurA [Jannaschia faecimaris]